MTQTLRFRDGGQIDCLYTEAIDLHALGRLKVVRATDIRFDHHKQEWDVHDAETGTVLFSQSSREACLRWERETLQPQAASSNPKPQT